MDGSGYDGIRGAGSGPILARDNVQRQVQNNGGPIEGEQGTEGEQSVCRLFYVVHLGKPFTTFGTVGYRR